MAINLPLIFLRFSCKICFSNTRVLIIDKSTIYKHCQSCEPYGFFACQRIANGFCTRLFFFFFVAFACENLSLTAPDVSVVVKRDKWLQTGFRWHWPPSESACTRANCVEEMRFRRSVMRCNGMQRTLRKCISGGILIIM